MKIYLASKSPRRKELLTQMGVEFEVLPIDIPEIVASHETPEAYSLRVTKEKLMAANIKMMSDHLVPRPVLSADTEVVFDGKILGKPVDQAHAFSMLKNYSGRTHQVITSVGVSHGDNINLRMQKTNITFVTLSDADINHYLAMDDYKDKAGSYGIQSYIGQFIQHIEGCFYSVMGLPLHIVRELLLDPNPV